MEANNPDVSISRWANVRLTEEEHQALDRIQTHLQTTRSRLLRKAVRELIGMGPDMLPQEWKAFEDLAYQVALDGDLPAAIQTPSGLVSAPDPRKLPSPSARKRGHPILKRESRRRPIRSSGTIARLRRGRPVRNRIAESPTSREVQRRETARTTSRSAPSTSVPTAACRRRKPAP